MLRLVVLLHEQCVFIYFSLFPINRKFAWAKVEVFLYGHHLCRLNWYVVRAIWWRASISRVAVCVTYMRLWYGACSTRGRWRWRGDLRKQLQDMRPHRFGDPDVIYELTHVLRLLRPTALGLEAVGPEFSVEIFTRENRKRPCRSSILPAVLFLEAGLRVLVRPVSSISW